MSRAVHLWNYCICHQITSITVLLPVLQKVLLDHLSRQFANNHEWSVKDTIIYSKHIPHVGSSNHRHLCHQREEEFPQVLLQWRAEPGISVLTHSLSLFPRSNVCLPSNSIDPEIVKKLRHNSSKMIMVAPVWPRQFWFLGLMNLSTQSPIQLPG